MLTTAVAAALPELAQAHLVGLGPGFLDPETMIERFGALVLVGIVVVIFVETGLLFPILPGDSLLFTAGALVAHGNFPVDINIWTLCLLMFLAAFLGDQTGFLIGRKLGPRVFNKPDSRFFKQSYIDQTYGYFDRYGGRTIIVARFVPIVRTYAPVAAGVGKMRYRHFVTYNAIGALAWGVGVTLLGYALGNVPFIRDNIESLLVVIVLVSVIPIGIELWRARRNRPTGVDGRDERYDDEQERRDVERKAFE